MAELKDWNVAAASNNGTPPDGAPEGMAPSAVNDTMRENMAVLARWKKDNDGSVTTGGSSNAYTLTPNGTYSAYAAGDTFTFEANHTNTASATLNVSSLGAKTVKLTGGATLLAGMLVAGGIYRVAYDGTSFLLLNPSLVNASGELQYQGDAEFGGADAQFGIFSGTVTLDGSDSTTPVNLPTTVARTSGFCMLGTAGNTNRGVFAYAKEGDVGTGSVGDLVQDDSPYFVVACGATNLTVATSSSGSEGVTVNYIILKAVTG